MNRPSLPFVVTVTLAVIGAFAFAQRISVTRRSHETALKSTKREQSLLNARMTVLQAQLAAPAHEPAANPSSMAAVPAGSIGTTRARFQLTPLQVAVHQAAVRARYQPFCDQLNLSEEQVAQFNGWLAQREAMIAADQPRGNLEHTALTQLLGEQGYRQLLEYERTLPARESVRTLAGQAAVAGVPLTREQADTLIEALAQGSANYRSGRAVTTIDWQAALGSAHAILTPLQEQLITGTFLADDYLDRLKALANGEKVKAEPELLGSAPH